MKSGMLEYCEEPLYVFLRSADSQPPPLFHSVMLGQSHEVGDHDIRRTDRKGNV